MWGDVKFICITKIEVRVSSSIFLPHFIERKGEFAIGEVMHEFKLRKCDKFIQWKNFMDFEKGGCMGSEVSIGNGTYCLFLL